MVQSVPIQKGPPVLIDLTARTSTDGGGRVFGLTPRTPQVAEHGAVTTSSTPAKGKRIAHTIEKDYRLWSLSRKGKDQNGSIEVFVFWNIMAFCI
jgi:hypothetical protein